MTHAAAILCVSHRDTSDQFCTGSPTQHIERKKAAAAYTNLFLSAKRAAVASPLLW